MAQATPLIIGRYAVFDEIASGGMATVHLGRLGVSLILWDALRHDDGAFSSARLEIRPALGGATGAVRWTF